MFTEFRSSFKVASISNIFLPLMLKVVSSAYISIADVKVINPTKSTYMLIGTKQRKAMMEKEFNINETSVDTEMCCPKGKCG
jgi:hypothetical protein